MASVSWSCQVIFLFSLPHSIAKAGCACPPLRQAFPTCILQDSASLFSTHELLALPCGGCPWISAVFCSEGCGQLQGALVWKSKGLSVVGLVQPEALSKSLYSLGFSFPVWEGLVLEFVLVGCSIK